MKIIKPLKQGILFKNYEDNGTFYFTITVCNFFPFYPEGVLHSEIDMWAMAGEELGKNAMLDFGMPKPRGEVIVAGKFFSPGGQPVQGGKVRLKLGEIDKSLYVFGKRYWRQRADGTFNITDPEPVTVVDISYENSFGGSGYALNPIGKGITPIELPGGIQQVPLPQVEHPQKLITSPKEAPHPASFASVDMTWPQRLNKAGTFDEQWFNERFPGIAKDLDWTFYNAAPEDQQIDGFFTGSEAFEIEGMHPEKQHLKATLPGIRSRCFVNHESDGELLFKEIQLRPDTVWLFPHIEHGIVIYRGTLKVSTDDAEDIKHLLSAYEKINDKPKSFEHYRDALTRRLDKEKGYLFSLNEKDLIPPGEQSAFAEMMESDTGKMFLGESLIGKHLQKRAEKEKEKIRAQLKAENLDPDLCDFAPLDNEEIGLDNLETIDELILGAKDKQKEAEKKVKELLAEQGLDYDQIVAEAESDPTAKFKFSADDIIAQLLEYGIDDPKIINKLRLAEQTLNKTYREYGHFFPAAPVPSEAKQARLRKELLDAYATGESLHGRDFTGVDLSGLNLEGIDLQNAFLEKTNFSETNLTGANLSSSILVRANLKNAILVEADLQSAGLSKADLSGADLTQANLAETSLVKADLSRAIFLSANLNKADLSEAKLFNSRMKNASLTECRFMDGNLSGADFAGANLSQAFFLNTIMQEVTFSKTVCNAATMIGVQADRCVFTEADLTNIRILNNSSFKTADFSKVSMQKANLRGTNFEKSSFENANISESDFSECNLQMANFYRAVAKQTQFIKADLTQARMDGINLMGGSLQKAILYNTSLLAANLSMVDFMRVRFKNTDISGANLTKTSIKRWIPK